MARRRRRGRMDILDWWQGVLDETKDFMDDTIDRARDDDLEDDVDELKEAVAQLNAKLDRLLAAGPTTPTKPSREVVIETPASPKEEKREGATP